MIGSGSHVTAEDSHFPDHDNYAIGKYSASYINPTAADVGPSSSSREEEHPATSSSCEETETCKSLGSPRTPAAMLRYSQKCMSFKMGITRQLASRKGLNRAVFKPCLKPLGWVAHEGGKGSEVLIHIHGYNSACQHGVKVLFCAMTSFSSP
jgi:hypothetical protein